MIGNASPEDETMARILKEYTGKDPRVKNVPIPENIGIAENTNAALAAAAGNFVGFMDHDDLLAPDALFEIAIRLEKIRPSMLFIPMRTRYGPICPSISSRISNRISIWICCGQTIISAISSLYGGRLRRKPAAFVRNTMGRRIMIISSAARKWRENCTHSESFISLEGPQRFHRRQSGKQAVRV